MEMCMAAPTGAFRELLGRLRDDEPVDRRQFEALIPWRRYRIVRDRFLIGVLEYRSRVWVFPARAIKNFFLGEKADPLRPLVEAVEERMYLQPEAARLLGLSNDQLYRLRKEGLLQGEQITPGRFAYAGSELRGMLENAWQPPREFEE